MGPEPASAKTDIEKMTPAELLRELADRLVDMQAAEDALEMWREENPDYDPDSECRGEEAGLRMAADEAWCRVREVVRLVKGDPHLWTC